MRVLSSVAVAVLLVGSAAYGAQPTPQPTNQPAAAGQGSIGPAFATAADARKDIEKTFGFTPGFLKVVPDVAISGAWDEMKNFQMNPNTVLSNKVKELIGLGVAAQVPCHYCTYAHTAFAKLNGATDREIGEAITMAALTRHWSTFLNGIQEDDATYRKELSQSVDAAKKAMAPNAPPPPQTTVTDVASARRDAVQSFGVNAEFLKRFPDAAFRGGYVEMRDVEMAPNTALSGKDKELIALGVGAQIPCRYCVLADTEYAKLNGATQQEIDEALAMAAITRHWSTMLNGFQVDDNAFRKDVDRMVAGARKKMGVGGSGQSGGGSEQNSGGELQPVPQRQRK